MSDGGQGIRLFSSEEALRNIFEEWEAEQPDSDDDDDADSNVLDSNPNIQRNDNEKDYILISQLRHFIAQPYIHPPLLLPSSGHHKFHIRTYVLAAGSLRVYVYKEMLALFAANPYTPPCQPNNNSDDTIDLTAHLTNTCLQTETGSRKNTVRRFGALDDDLPSAAQTQNHSQNNWKHSVHAQICAITAEVFEAAARGMMVHFQTLLNAFEIFGVDFLVDATGKAWLLEVNAFPDFKQTGEEFKGVVGGLFESVVDVAVRPFFGVGGKGRRERSGSGGLEMVLDLDLGRR